MPVLIHRGIECGTQRTSVLPVLPITDGYAFVVDYQQLDQPEGAWARDVLAAGTANLWFGAEMYGLSNPRLESFGAACARLGYWIDGLPKSVPGTFLLVVDKDHRCPGLCGRRPNRQWCRRCASHCPRAGRDKHTPET